MQKVLKLAPFFLLPLLVIAGTLYMVRTYTPNVSYKDQVAVLLYHHISDMDTSSVTITPALFREQLTYLRERNYQFITMQQFKEFMAGGEVPDKAVLVTFDDGYESLYEKGYPILKELQIPAVNFVITETLDNPPAGSLKFMNQEELQALASSKEVNIDCQCHSDGMHNKQDGNPLLITNLVIDGQPETDTQYDERVLRDAKLCSDKLRSNGSSEPDAYAYPYGFYNKHASSLLQKAGFRYGFTVVSEITTKEDDPMQIARITGGSPWVKPKSLDRAIQRSVIDGKKPADYVSFRKIVEDLDGTVDVAKDRTVSFHVRGKHGKIKPDTSTIELSGAEIPLKHPAKIKSRKVQIHYEDLQQIFGIDVVHIPFGDEFKARVTPKRSQTDS
ncbi:polysaccharide deacetylase family protein [Paenibacillus lutrae]|uniref:Polysaccharide deacetylase family protein n=1 Tax=Paenibacillus lutrae TaxID=2078573 RepID=A0A7X3FGI5_9BACL|nr:polysaccharide deacetylase family protein [Paenibacillus lutrae]MVO99058.1 polysaccharide deacetylase family protein [Paenibacillus lutrae]